MSRNKQLFSDESRGDAEALAERMAWCIEHPAAVAEMGPAAAEAAQAYSWAAYHERVVEVLRAVAG